MAKVYLGLGSNLEANKNICFGLDELDRLLVRVRCSPVYESESVGFSGSNFINLVVEGETDLSIAELSASLKSIENSSGRDRSSPKFSDRTLDIDVLLYDDYVGDCEGIKLPRDEIKKNAFVLAPLADLAGDLVYPGSNSTIAALWQGFPKNKQRLWTVEFFWGDKKLS